METHLSSLRPSFTKDNGLLGPEAFGEEHEAGLCKTKQRKSVWTPTTRAFRWTVMRPLVQELSENLLRTKARARLSVDS